MTADALQTDEQKNELYIKIKSAAESGFDFSTRWFIKDGTNAGEFKKILFLFKREIHIHICWAMPRGEWDLDY